jgi:DNA-binding NarL/FixJ family response regulator
MTCRVRGSVLVVDDDPAFRAAARRLLETQGLLVVGEAGTASDAFATAMRLQPDAVLVDVGLPDDDGVALAHRLAALPWQPRMLLTSTDPDAVGPDELTHERIVGFLPKQDLPDAALHRLLRGQ